MDVKRITADWVRDPLLHFIVLGAALFAAYAWMGEDVKEAPRVLRVTAAEVNWLSQTWARQWSRVPNEDELRGLLSEYLKEALLAREAKELGLDENDTIVRRRLAQKMAFLLQDTTRIVSSPGEMLLREFYEVHRADYTVPATASFQQIFFASEAAAQAALTTLNAGDGEALGDPSLLDREYADVDRQRVAATFGDDFAEQLFAMSKGRWQGPVASAYGFHLARVDTLQPAQSQSFETVEEQVREAWLREQQDEAGQRFFASLLSKYEIVVDAEVRPLMAPLAGTTR